MDDRSTLCDALCHVLGNTCRISRTAKSYEWNAEGRGALAAQACFRAQADELHAALEPLAQSILGLGAPAILDYSDTVVAITPPTAADVPPLKRMIHNLSHGQVQAMHSIGAAIDLARGMDEHGVLSMLSDRITVHRAHRRSLSLLAAEL
ncbi:MAG: ferritin-like domain-containing protein [Pseudomonadota bacterium]